MLARWRPVCCEITEVSARAPFVQTVLQQANLTYFGKVTLMADILLLLIVLIQINVYYNVVWRIFLCSMLVTERKSNLKPS